MQAQTSENERVNHELSEMKSKFKHLMTDYVGLKKKVHHQHEAAAKFDKQAFKEDIENVFDAETARGIEESRNLVKDVNESEQEKKEAPTRELETKEQLPQPVATADGHHPTPVGAIAKPKGKGDNLGKQAPAFPDQGKPGAGTQGFAGEVAPA